MKPTVGKIVDYKATNRDTEPLAAIIYAVHEDSIDLNIIRAGQLEFARNKTQAENFKAAEAGQWSWPERV